MATSIDDNAVIGQSDKSMYQLIYIRCTSVSDYDDAEEQLKESGQYSAEELFCCAYAPFFWQAVQIRYSQFEKIPLSAERQIAIIERQIDEIELAIEQAKADKGERYTIKQMEKSRKSLLTRLEKLNDNTRKDNVVTFEQLGVDRLFVDESHNYKNLFLYTKMRNVAGIAQSEAQKSSDMFAKCQYLDELTGSKGVTFATGTPISNSMTELYTNMRYLQYDTLQKLGLGHFDIAGWSSGKEMTELKASLDTIRRTASELITGIEGQLQALQLERAMEQAQEKESLLLVQTTDLSEYSLLNVRGMDAQELVAALADMSEDDKLSVQAYLESKGAWTTENYQSGYKGI